MAVRRRRRSSPAGRRRWLVLFGAVLLMVVAVLANIGPLTHYQDARGRLDTAAAKVSALEAQKAELQGQLAKLSEAGYLETLAREQLTYVRPGEELYIVTDPTDDVAGGDSTLPQVAPGAAALVGIGAAALDALGRGATTTERAPADSESTVPGQAGSEPGSTDSPGFLERIVSAIRGLF
jgi:cell division protein FtsB